MILVRGPPFTRCDASCLRSLGATFGLAARRQCRQSGTTTAVAVMNVASLANGQRLTANGHPGHGPEQSAPARRYYYQRILAPGAFAVQDFVTPDTLDELDRRVYDLAIQHIPLAEMAVRLGVPVSQADDKLQRVFRRLGVEDRDGLRAIESKPVPPPDPATPDPSPNEYVIGGDDYVIGLDTPAPEGAAERRFSRRAVLGAWGAAALAVGTGGVFPA